MINLNCIKSITDVLTARADIQSDRLSYAFLSGGDEVDRLTFAQLRLRALAVAAYLQEIKAENERALLLYPAGLDYVVSFFGCCYAKTMAVPAYPPRRNQNLTRLLAIIDDSEPKVALTTSAILSRLQGQISRIPRLQSIQWVMTDDIAPDLADCWKERETTEKDIAFLQYTSGSTSAPKGVLVSHGNLLDNQAMMRERLGHDDDTVIVSWLPMYHDMGLIGNALAGIYNGAPCYLMPHTDFLQKPARWLEAITRYKATFSGGPNFAYDLCARKTLPEQREWLDLSSWKTAFNGSEPVRSETLRRFAEIFSPCGFRPEALYPCYGLAEATLFVSGGAVSKAPVITTFDKAALEENMAVASDGIQNGVTLVSAGKPGPGERVITVDPQTGVKCDEGRVGEIWVSGASVTRGYWGRPELTDEIFRARLSGANEGSYLRTGDLGVIFQGDLYVTGRLKDLIVIRGRNHYPQDLELAAETCHRALSPGGAAAFAVAGRDGEEVILVAELNRAGRIGVDVNEVVESVRQAILEEHDIDVSAIVLIRPGRLSRTSSGKVQRGAIRSAYLSESLEPIYQWKRAARRQAPERAIQLEGASRDLESLKSWLEIELSSRLNISSRKIDPDRPIAYCGLDSLAASEFVISIEESFGIQFPVDKLFIGTPSVSELAVFLHEQLQLTRPDYGDERNDNDEMRTGKAFETRPPILQSCEPPPRAFDVAARDGQSVCSW